MKKAYWVATYQSLDDPAKHAAYAKIAAPVIAASGGRFLVRGTPIEAYELGVKERTVVIEFDSLDAALAAHEAPAYKEALAALEGGVRRDLRIIEGM